MARQHNNSSDVSGRLRGCHPLVLRHPANPIGLCDDTNCNRSRAAAEKITVLTKVLSYNCEITRADLESPTAPAAIAAFKRWSLCRCQLTCSTLAVMSRCSRLLAKSVGWLKKFSLKGNPKLGQPTVNKYVGSAQRNSTMLLYLSGRITRSLLLKHDGIGEHEG